MKIKNKFTEIIVVLGAIILVSGTSLLGELSNHKDSYLSTADTRENTNYLILVNKKNSLNLNYKSNNLVKTNIEFLANTEDEEQQLDETAAKAVEELVQVAKEEGISLLGSSAYRSYKSQVEIYSSSIKNRGVEYTKEYVAMPGKSEHQTGLAIDITNESRFMTKYSEEAQWLASNAYRFGFILRYPEGKEDITGVAYEPWHIRYVGKDAAKEIHDKEITLEEYLEIK